MEVSRAGILQDEVENHGCAAAEEPDAAATISTAMNELSQVAMRTTELQAFQVLKGEIITQMNKDVSQTVAFQTTGERVKSMLGPAAQDRDIVQLFDFLISNGVGKNSYIDELLHWAMPASIPIRGDCALQPSDQSTRCAHYHSADVLLPSERTVGSRRQAIARTQKARGGLPQ